jgi:tetratricopeptide (TPR) repeat protein
VTLVLLLFYGFAVFALTRDYYLRHPAVPATAGAPPRHAEGAPAWVGGSALEAGSSAIPDGVIERDPVLLGQRADQLFAQRRYREAIELYRGVIELDPGDADAHNDLGLALYYSGDGAAALPILEAGLGLAPNDQRLWLTLGFVRGRAGDKSGSEEALLKAKGLNSTNDIGQEASRLLEALRKP